MRVHVGTICEVIQVAGGWPGVDGEAQRWEGGGTGGTCTQLSVNNIKDMHLRC